MASDLNWVSTVKGDWPSRVNNSPGYQNCWDEYYTHNYPCNWKPAPCANAGFAPRHVDSTELSNRKRNMAFLHRLNVHLSGVGSKMGWCWNSYGIPLVRKGVNQLPEDSVACRLDPSWTISASLSCIFQLEKLEALYKSISVQNHISYQTSICPTHNHLKACLPLFLQYQNDSPFLQDFLLDPDKGSIQLHQNDIDAQRNTPNGKISEPKRRPQRCGVWLSLLDPPIPFVYLDEI